MWKRLLLLSLLVLQALLPAAQARGGAPGTIPEIAAAELPREALEVLQAIRRGGPFRYAKDGTIFFNRERQLPIRPRGHYREYTVPTPRARDRGARRIVTGGDPRVTDELFYTRDHYRSFHRIREPAR